MGTQGEAAQTKPGEPQVSNTCFLLSLTLICPLTHSIVCLFAV